jgi:2-oxoglutarate ferredoxin oxidoreductase subunit alpha
MVHFAQVWPVNFEAARSLLKTDDTASRKPTKITSVEGNATGQFASLLREVGVLSECGLMLRYDGIPFTGEEIAARIRQ